MKTVEDVLNALNLDGGFVPLLDAGWRESMAACPSDAPFFTDWKFLAEQSALAGIGEEVLLPLSEVAERIRAEEPLRLLAWHAHHTLCRGSAVSSLAHWPELNRVLGENCGIFYLIIGLSAIPVFAQTYRKLGIPEEYVAASTKWLGGTVDIYRSAHGGRPGHTRSQLHWMRNYIDGKLFRIGRFEFMNQLHPDSPAVFVYRSRTSGQVMALAAAGTACSADGFVLYEDQERREAAFVTRLTRDADTVSGNPVLPQGIILDRTVQLPSAEWENVLKPGDFTPGIHIPGGGAMTPEACRESLKEALRFYAAYFPEKPVKAFVCSSWIFNPDWEHLLPDSNLTKFLRSCYLYPQRSNGREGLFFLFGKDYGDTSEYPRDNSARRAMLNILESGGRLRREGMFFLPEELERFATEPYRTGQNPPSEKN